MVKLYHLIGVALGIGVMMTSKPEAIAEPMIAKGTLKHLIKVGESGKRGYNSYNRGSRFSLEISRKSRIESSKALKAFRFSETPQSSITRL